MLNKLSSDFICPNCKRELSTQPLSYKIFCKFCKKNFIIGTYEQFHKLINLWTNTKSPFSEIYTMFQDFFVKKELTEHLLISVMKLWGINLTNNDKMIGKTNPAEDYIDSDGNYYELITCKPFIFVDQTPFIQFKINEKIEKYEKMKINLSKLTLIILDFSNPIGDSAQPIFYNQTDFGYKKMQKFKQYFFIRPWYIKDISDFQKDEFNVGFENFGTPTQWISVRGNLASEINNIVLNKPQKKWNHNFKLTDFFDFIQTSQEYSTLSRRLKIKLQKTSLLE